MFSAWRWARGAATAAAALAAAAVAVGVVVSGGLAGAPLAWAAPAPVVTSAPVAGSVAVAGPDGFGVVLAGTSAPGTVVEVTMPVEGDGYPLCLVAVEPDGSWVCPIGIAPSSPGPAIVSNGVDFGAPDVTALDFGLLNPPMVEMDPGSTDTITPTMTIEDPTQEIRGTGVPFNLVTVRLNDGSGCSTIAGADSTWSCLLTALPTGPGPYTLVASQAFPPAPDATATTPPIVFALEAPTIVDPGPGSGPGPGPEPGPEPGPDPEPWPGSDPGIGPGPPPGSGSDPGTVPGSVPGASAPPGAGTGTGGGIAMPAPAEGDGEDFPPGGGGPGFDVGNGSDGAGGSSDRSTAGGSDVDPAGQGVPLAGSPTLEAATAEGSRTGGSPSGGSRAGGSRAGGSRADGSRAGESAAGESAADGSGGSTAASAAPPAAGSGAAGPSAFSSALASVGDVTRKGTAGLLFLGAIVAAAVVLVMVLGGVLEATIHENSERIRRSAPVRGLVAAWSLLRRWDRRPAAGPPAHGSAARGPAPGGPAAGGSAALGSAALRSAALRSASLGRAVHGPASLGSASLGRAVHGPAALGSASLGRAVHGPAALGPASLGRAVHGPAVHVPTARRPGGRSSAAGVAVVLGVGAVAAAGVAPGAGVNAATLGLVLAFFGAGVVMGGVGVGAVVVVGRRHGLHGVPFGRPVALLLTVASVVVSRAAGLDPGFVFGALVGVQFVALAPLSPRRSAVSGHTAARLAVVGAATSVGLGLAAWVAQGALRPGVALRPDLAGVLVLDLLTAVTVGALSGPVVSLLPVRFLEGRAVFEHSRRLWALSWGGVALVFGLVLLPVPEAWNEVGGALVPWLAGFAVFAALTAAVWAWFRYVPAPEAAPDATRHAAPDATPDATPDAAPDATPGAAPDQRSSRATSRETGSLSR